MQVNISWEVAITVFRIGKFYWGMQLQRLIHLETNQDCEFELRSVHIQIITLEKDMLPPYISLRALY